MLMFKKENIDRMLKQIVLTLKILKHFFNIKNTTLKAIVSRGWEDGSVGKVFPEQA